VRSRVFTRLHISLGTTQALSKVVAEKENTTAADKLRSPRHAHYISIREHRHGVTDIVIRPSRVPIGTRRNYEKRRSLTRVTRWISLRNAFLRGDEPATLTRNCRYLSSAFNSSSDIRESSSGVFGLRAARDTVPNNSGKCRPTDRRILVAVVWLTS